VPSQVQRQLEETKRRDASHAALLAAVARRKSLLDSTDADEVAKSIESRIRRNTKIQTVFPARPSRPSTSSVAPTGLLAPADKPEKAKVEVKASKPDASKVAENGTSDSTPASKPDAPEVTESGRSEQEHCTSSLAPADVVAPHSKFDTPTVVENSEYMITCYRAVNSIDLAHRRPFSV